MDELIRLFKASLKVSDSGLILIDNWQFTDEVLKNVEKNEETYTEDDLQIVVLLRDSKRMDVLLDLLRDKVARTELQKDKRSVEGILVGKIISLPNGGIFSHNSIFMIINTEADYQSSILHKTTASIGLLRYLY